MTATGATNLKPLGVGEILDAAIRVYRNNFKTLTMAVLVVVLPLAIIDTLITASTSENAFDYSGTATTTDIDGSFWAGQIASGILSILLFAVATAACFHAVMRGYLGESATWQESLAFGFKRMGPIILLGIVAFLGLIPMFILLIIPGIWLAVRWSVAAPALLAEDIGPVKALGRSFGLVGGRWWATFGALVAMTILIFILSALVGLLMGLVFADAGSEVVAAIVFTLVTALAYAITLPIQSAVFTILYYDLRVRKEGYDLQLAARGMGDAPSAIPGEPASSGGGFSPPAQAGDGGFSPPQPASGSPLDTSGSSAPPPSFGGGAIPTPVPATPPSEPSAPAYPPGGTSTGDTPAYPAGGTSAGDEPPAAADPAGGDTYPSESTYPGGGTSDGDEATPPSESAPPTVPAAPAYPAGDTSSGDTASVPTEPPAAPPPAEPAEESGGFSWSPTPAEDAPPPPGEGAPPDSR